MLPLSSQIHLSSENFIGGKSVENNLNEWVVLGNKLGNKNEFWEIVSKNLQIREIFEKKKRPQDKHLQ